MAAESSKVFEVNGKRFVFGLDWYAIRSKSDPRKEAMKYKQRKVCSHYLVSDSRQLATALLRGELNKKQKKEKLYSAAQSLLTQYKNFIGFWRVSDTLYWLAVIKDGQVLAEVGDYVTDDFKDALAKFKAAYKRNTDAWETIVAPEAFEIENSVQTELGQILYLGPKLKVLESPPTFIVTKAHLILAGAVLAGLVVLLWPDMKAEFRVFKQTYWDDKPKPKSALKVEKPEPKKTPIVKMSPSEAVGKLRGFTNAVSICLDVENILRFKKAVPGWNRTQMICNVLEEFVTYDLEFIPRAETPISTAYSLGLKLEGNKQSASWSYSTQLPEKDLKAKTLMPFGQFQRTFNTLKDMTEASGDIEEKSERKLKVLADYDEYSWKYSTDAAPAIWMGILKDVPALEINSITVAYSNPLTYKLEGKVYVTP